jgi:hypothetical protein
MINNSISKVTHLLVLVSLLLFASCSQPTFFKPTMALSTGTIAFDIKTLTPPIIYITQIPTTQPPTLVPTQTDSPTPSLTPLATLSPDAAQEVVSRLMATNDSCSGLCFWGIYPGISSYDQAVRFLKTLQENGMEGTKNSERYFDPTMRYKNGNLMVNLAISESNGVVHGIGASLGNLHASDVKSKDWQAFRPDGILKAYGVPKQIKIIMGIGPEGRVGYDMMLIYDQMYIRYTGNQTMVLPQKIMHACPLPDHNIDQFDLWIGKYDPNILNDGVDLTRMSSLTVESFYKIFVGDPQKACFDLDYQKYLSPRLY